MFVVVLLFVAATVVVPAAQALLASGARDLPLGLSDVKGLIYVVTLVVGVTALFAALCAIYRLVPKARMPWAAVWPGALGATVAIGIVDLGFPLYLDNISTLRIGTSAVFVLIALVWFYVIALILLAGAVVNELRFEHISRSACRARLKPGPDQPNTQDDSYPESSFGDEASPCHDIGRRHASRRGPARSRFRPRGGR